jgi:hypothetical protein
MALYRQHLMAEALFPAKDCGLQGLKAEGH